VKERGEQNVFYETTVTPFGELGIVWRSKENGDSFIVHIFLPLENVRILSPIQRFFPTARRFCCETIKKIGSQIMNYLQGAPTDFSFGYLDMNYCYKFQKRVLIANRAIPRGKVCSYGDLASKVHVSAAARAVGTALAKNPFPLVIPCHRVVKSNGRVGGFGGGLKMKRALLELEGVKFDIHGKVCREYFQSG
jgi:methylated-DNA-[protein]-cysteine S-methyltransferase